MGAIESIESIITISLFSLFFFFLYFSLYYINIHQIFCFYGMEWVNRTEPNCLNRNDMKTAKIFLPRFHIDVYISVKHILKTKILFTSVFVAIEVNRFQWIPRIKPNKEKMKEWKEKFSFRSTRFLFILDWSKWWWCESQKCMFLLETLLYSL